MTLKAQVARGLKWQAIDIIGRQLLSLIVFTTLARLLDPSAFGKVALVGVYMAFVAMFADQGIGAALVQRSNLKPEHLNAAYWFNVGCAVLLCAGTIVLAGPVSRLLGEPELIPLLRWMSPALIINAMSAIHATLFIKAMDFRRPTIRTLVGNAVGGIVGIGMAVTHYGVWALIGQQLAASVGSAVFLWAASPYRPSLKFSLPHLKDLFGVSTSVFSTTLLWYFSSRIDQIVVGRFAGVPALGVYVIAGKVPDLARVITHEPMAHVSLPALSRLQNNHKRMQAAIYSGMELNALLSFAVFVGIAAIAPELVSVLFGAKWAAAGVLCSLLSIYGLVNALQVFFHPSLLASGGAGRYVLLNVWQAAGSLVAGVGGIHLGVKYVVIGLILNNLIITVPALMFLRKRIGLSPLEYCKPCLVPACASLFMLGVLWLVGSMSPPGLPAIVGLICKVAIGAAAYSGFSLLFQRSTLMNLIAMIRHAISPNPETGGGAAQPRVAH
jgi:O-antigen/teichoic acid export membrane protein